MRLTSCFAKADFASFSRVSILCCEATMSPRRFQPCAAWDCRNLFRLVLTEIARGARRSICCFNCSNSGDIGGVLLPVLFGFGLLVGVNVVLVLRGWPGDLTVAVPSRKAGEVSATCATNEFLIMDTPGTAAAISAASARSAEVSTVPVRVTRPFSATTLILAVVRFGARWSCSDIKFKSLASVAVG